MSEVEYDRLAVDRPDLRLPWYWQLDLDFRVQLQGMTVDNFVAARVSALMGRDHPDKPKVESMTDVKIV